MQPAKNGMSASLTQDQFDQTRHLCQGMIFRDHALCIAVLHEEASPLAGKVMAPPCSAILAWRGLLEWNQFLESCEPDSVGPNLNLFGTQLFAIAGSAAVDAIGAPIGPFGNPVGLSIRIMREARWAH